MSSLKCRILLDYAKACLHMKNDLILVSISCSFPSSQPDERGGLGGINKHCREGEPFTAMGDHLETIRDHILHWETISGSTV